MFLNSPAGDVYNPDIQTNGEDRREARELGLVGADAQTIRETLKKLHEERSRNIAVGRNTKTPTK